MTPQCGVRTATDRGEKQRRIKKRLCVVEPRIKFSAEICILRTVGDAGPYNEHPYENAPKTILFWFLQKQKAQRDYLPRTACNYRDFMI